MVEATSPGTLTSLDHASAYSINKEVIKIATEAIKRSRGGIEFQSEGKTYYGVKEIDLGHLLSHKPAAILLADILEQVVVACDEASVPQYSLKKALSSLRIASVHRESRDCQARCHVYYRHAGRMMARLIVLYQGYYGVHPDKVSTFKTTGGVGKGGSKPAPHHSAKRKVQP
ncbi:hypothetical protein QFC20_007627 [Naganishia adeliensis]|uniref:Uncharacterized protein n=1 Tax=Naganishia adeliensis TaxID=92952 RepID=A0ACC2UXD6_9TREE|nr:hypothetical protein QFC20_007627 [Naganishia adeliensis]